METLQNKFYAFDWLEESIFIYIKGTLTKRFPQFSLVSCRY